MQGSELTKNVYTVLEPLAIRKDLTTEAIKTLEQTLDALSKSKG